MNKAFQTTLLILSFAVFFVSCGTQMTFLAPEKKEFYVPRSWDQPIVVSPEARKKIESSRVVISSKPSKKEPNDKTTPVIDNNRNGQGVTQNFDGMKGVASWYGPAFHGGKTANGEIYDQYAMTVAHQQLPLGSLIRIRNLDNGREVVARVNDRGPYAKDRILDGSRAVAEKLDYVRQGTANVKLTIVSMPSSYDNNLGPAAYKQSVIQLAVFGNKSNAQNYLEKFSKRYQQLPAIIDEPKPNQYQVVIGPYDHRTQAKEIYEGLKRDGLNGLVRSYRK